MLFFCFVFFSWGRLDIFSLSEEWCDPLITPHHTPPPSPLSNSQTSCLPSMFSFFLARCDGIPCSVSCCEGPLLGYSRGRRCHSRGRVCRRLGGSVSFPDAPKAAVNSGTTLTKQQPPKEHSTLLSLSCWSWLYRLLNAQGL